MRAPFTATNHRKRSWRRDCKPRARIDDQPWMKDRRRGKQKNKMFGYDGMQSKERSHDQCARRGCEALILPRRTRGVNAGAVQLTSKGSQDFGTNQAWTVCACSLGLLEHHWGRDWRHKADFCCRAAGMGGGDGRGGAPSIQQ